MACIAIFLGVRHGRGRHLGVSKVLPVVDLSILSTESALAWSKRSGDVRSKAEIVKDGRAERFVRALVPVSSRSLSYS